MKLIQTIEDGRMVLLLRGEFDTSRLELALEVTNVRELAEWLGIVVPTGVERHRVLLEHALKEPDGVVAVLHDQLGTASLL